MNAAVAAVFSKTEQRFMIKRRRTQRTQNKRISLAGVLLGKEFIYKNHMIKKYRPKSQQYVMLALSYLAQLSVAALF